MRKIQSLLLGVNAHVWENSESVNSSIIKLEVDAIDLLWDSSQAAVKCLRK